MIEHNEFVVEFKDNTRDWVDPVIDIQEDECFIHLNNGRNYTFDKSLISKWVVRPYHTDTTYNSIE